MGQTSRDIAGALNFRSGLVPMAFDVEPAKEPERIRFASTEAKTPAQRRREAAEAEAAKKTAQDDDMSDMGMTGDPPTSEAQRKAMWAAKSGNSTLGIPQSVGAEFAKADPGGKLPSHAKDREIEFAPDKLYGVQTPDGGTGGPDNAVKVHDKQTDYEPRKGRWGGRVGHSMAKDASGPGLETEKAENNESGTGAELEESAGRRGGRASPHLRSGQGMDGGPGSGPQTGGGEKTQKSPKEMTNAELIEATGGLKKNYSIEPGGRRVYHD